MKYFVTIVFAGLMFTACKNSGSGGFTVSGTIKNAPSDSVYLELLSYDSPDAKKLDSAKLGSDGSYKLKGSSAQQNLFVVSFKENPAVIVINDGDDIKINFDPTGFHYPDISGSTATSELYSFIKDYLGKDSVLSKTYNQLDTLSEETSKDTNYVNQIKSLYTKQLSDLSSVVVNFINSSKNPAAICFVLDKAKGLIAPSELATLATNVSKRFPNHTGIASFATALNKPQQQPGDASLSNNYALLNQQAPDLTMTSPDGKQVSISSFRGKYLLVDFWASWCGPCRQENPNVVTAYNKFKDKNFTILGVSLDDDKQAWIDAIKKDNLTWNHMSDLQRESSAASLYQFDGIPFNVLIDPQGKIIASGLRGDALEQELSQVLQ